MTDTDLFGQPDSHATATVNRGGGRRKTWADKYAALPGTGPNGETCRSCAHYCRIYRAKTYLKCGLMQNAWTGGPGSDIKAASPACAKWRKDT